MQQSIQIKVLVREWNDENDINHNNNKKEQRK